MTKKMLFATATAFAFAGASYAQFNADADMPPNADPGECFARVLIPETTEIETETVVDRPETTEIKIIPAEYTTVTEEVLVKEATVTYEVIPAVYETVTEEVVVEPEHVVEIQADIEGLGAAGGTHRHASTRIEFGRVSGFELSFVELEVGFDAAVEVETQELCPPTAVRTAAKAVGA